MVLDCYIIREYLPNGKHTDHGYYERQEMLDDAKEFAESGTNFEIFPCTGSISENTSHNKTSHLCRAISGHGEDSIPLSAQ